MRYYFTFLAVFLLAATGLQAQFSLWEKLGNNVYNSNLGGQVGIGTPFPTERLDIFGNAKVSGGFSALGNVGVGLTDPAHKLSVNGDSYLSGDVGIGFANPVQKLSVNGHSYISGNVGIGVTVPQYKLDVNGSIATGLAIELNHHGVGDRNSYIDFRSSDTQTDFNTRILRTPGQNGPFRVQNTGSGAIEFWQNGSNKVRLLANGNLGIGITNPIQKLSVDGDINLNGNVLMMDYTNANDVDHIWNNDATNAFYFISDKGRKSTDTGTSKLFAGGLNMADTQTSNYIAGNLGIGVSNPAQKLSVDGDINLNGNVLMMDYTNANDVDYIKHNDDFNIWAFTSDSSVGNTLANGTLLAGNVNMGGGNNYFAGDVEIGDGPGTGLASLHVNGGLIGAGTYSPPNDPRINTRFSDGDMVLDVRSQLGSGNQQFGFFPDILGSVQSGHQFLNGEDSYPWTYTFSEHFRAASAGNYGTYSDKRLKSNIEPIENGLETISKLSPKIYDKNVNLIVAPSRQHDGLLIKDEPGFIAQEVEKILPQLVHTSEKGEQYKSLGMMGIIPYVVAAVNELKAEKDEEIEQKDKQLEAQKTEIKDLNSRVEKLEKALSILLEKEEATTAKTTTILLEGKQKTYLKQNRPNPFKGQTIIEHQIPNEVQKAELSISTLDGKILKTILLDTRGIGQTIVETRHMAKGEYIYTLILDGKIFESKTMILMH